MDVFGASPSGSRVTDSSSPASTILCRTAPVPPPTLNALGATSAATRPPPKSGDRSFSKANDMNSQVLSDCCGTPKRKAPDSRRDCTADAEPAQLKPHGASTITKSASKLPNSSCASVSPTASSASGTASKRRELAVTASRLMSWPRYRTWTPADRSAPTSRNPANPEPAAGSQISMDARLGSRRLRHPTASAWANDKLVVCSWLTEVPKKSACCAFGSSARTTWRAGCSCLKTCLPCHPVPRRPGRTTSRCRRLGAYGRGRW
ncbi:hypothetical protein SAMN02799620_03801 [Mycolicibacterium fluoranthenivorans]|uniref:Uncharacterized protein n=1 Tax=Mycolicibacterium fluoranthenivorans TaxID=258505 RepID=A0A1G4WKZ2_9MYCO|nr:hypothetical protein SAMN02799620_03801 [Mycolicibacterium fluoranthenivorans]